MYPPHHHMSNTLETHVSSSSSYVKHFRAQGLQFLLRCAQRGPGSLRQEGAHSLILKSAFFEHIVKSALFPQILKSRLL